MFAEMIHGFCESRFRLSAFAYLYYETVFDAVA